MYLHMENIVKNYDQPILKGLTYKFESGKIYVIKGVSGCGKSTLLNILGGLDTQYEGKILRSSTEFKCSYIFQNSLLLSRITVLDNLLLIKNDHTRINELCKNLGIQELLIKFPEQLSGGERQRVSIVRALLQEPNLILADEPTASLDRTNSEKVANILSQQKDKDRIIIVATHENCFDSFADEILYLEYGTINHVKYNASDLAKLERNDQPEVDTMPARKFNLVRYTVSRNSRILHLSSVIPLALAFFLILSMLTIQANFGPEYLRIMRSRYPMDYIIFTQQQFDSFSGKDQLKQYSNIVATENGIHAYYLLDEKDSVFSVENMIEVGSFPQTPNEILVSQEFVSYYFNSISDYDSVVGMTVDFGGMNLRVSGVLANLTDTWVQRILYSDIFYRRNISTNSIFIPYATIEEFGEPVASDYIACVFDNLPDNSEALNEIISILPNGIPNEFYSYIKEGQLMLDYISAIIVTILVICFIISCLFMISIIKTELYYRKKEMGYLQIFGLTRKRILAVTFFEYVLRLFYAFVLAMICFCILVVLYAGINKTNILFDCGTALIVNGSLWMIYLTTAYLSIRGFLKQTILNLITST